MALYLDGRRVEPISHAFGTSKVTVRFADDCSTLECEMGELTADGGEAEKKQALRQVRVSQ